MGGAGGRGFLFVLWFFVLHLAYVWLLLGVRDFQLCGVYFWCGGAPARVRGLSGEDSLDLFNCFASCALILYDDLSSILCDFLGVCGVG